MYLLVRRFGYAPKPQHPELDPVHPNSAVGVRNDHPPRNPVRHVGQVGGVCRGEDARRVVDVVDLDDVCGDGRGLAVGVDGKLEGVVGGVEEEAAVRVRGEGEVVGLADVNNPGTKGALIRGLSSLKQRNESKTLAHAQAILYTSS